MAKMICSLLFFFFKIISAILGPVFSINLRTLVYVYKIRF